MSVSLNEKHAALEAVIQGLCQRQLDLYAEIDVAKREQVANMIAEYEAETGLQSIPPSRRNIKQKRAWTTKCRAYPNGVELHTDVCCPHALIAGQLRIDFQVEEMSPYTYNVWEEYYSVRSLIAERVEDFREQMDRATARADLMKKGWETVKGMV